MAKAQPTGSPPAAPCSPPPAVPTPTSHGPARHAPTPPARPGECRNRARRCRVPRWGRDSRETELGWCRLPTAPEPDLSTRPAAALEGYLPLRRPARRACAALWVSILLALTSAAANLGDTRAARLLAGDGASAGDLYLWVGAGPGELVPGHGRAVAGLVPARLPQPAGAGGRRLRYRPWWAVGAWLLPVFSLFRPKQVLNDVWRASDPHLPPTRPTPGASGRWPSCSAGGGWRSWPRPGAQRHHRGCARRRRPDAARSAARTVRPLPALGRHADNGRPAQRCSAAC